jgi:probable F420-dependent oxidoreductase
VAHDRKFRFGTMSLDTTKGSELISQARRIEDLGYSTFYVPDHLVGHPLAPIPTMAAVAAATETLRVGSLVLCNDYKHPAVVATEIATIDVISDGRVELGIGAGWMTEDYERAGLTMDRAGVRIERLAESLAVLKGLFADGPFSYAGKHYTITELDGAPAPVQRPHPPIMIGGGGKKILSLAGREADIVGIIANASHGYMDDVLEARLLPAAVTDEMLGWVRDAAGDRYPDLEIQVMFTYAKVGDHVDAEVAKVATDVGVSTEDALQIPVVMMGSVSQIIEAIHFRRERWDMSYFVVMADKAEEFAPVVAALAGT